ncbi:sialate O-acetylesterase [Winogradskyella helgolandensis]|uniref:sialate O-acetylesterase n=1 Tax=Winogradskyella helgolandensis TaxID=2697010 RepID=UPI0015CB7622|nr:sialate O-acetylesterase [Winogradskyella helgolandensis]
MKKAILYMLLFVSNVMLADVMLPAIFSDHMVLQQNEDVKFWGWASPNEVVKISPSWTNEVYEVTTSSHVKWELNVKTPKAGSGYTITISGNNKIIINDVLIGEVWLCSGQSNMEMTASWGIENGDEEVAKANHNTIRFFRVEKSTSDSPQDHIIGKWEICTSETMKNNSAVAYFFATQLQEHIKSTPVGLIISSWGGTPAEVWMPKTSFENDKIISEAASKLQPQDWGPTKPAKAFNAMIAPLVGYNLAGALWYQGESNVGSLVYDKTLTALITSWRDLWQDNFPFYVVQIAPYDDGHKHFGGVIIRDAQRKVANRLEHTEMVVISDISPIDDIHPKNKKSVGQRLANIAMKKHYKVISNLVEFPELEQVTFNKEVAVVYFKNADGLTIKDKTSLFEIAGEDNVFYLANTRLKDKTIIVYSTNVKQPRKVRFAWGNALQSNVFNSAGLPASSFTTEK